MLLMAWGLARGPAQSSTQNPAQVLSSCLQVVAAAMAQDWWEKAAAAEKGAEVMAPVVEDRRIDSVAARAHRRAQLVQDNAEELEELLLTAHGRRLNDAADHVPGRERLGPRVI